jgi:hypothetical protein
MLCLSQQTLLRSAHEQSCPQITTSKLVFQQSPCSWSTETNKWSYSASRSVAQGQLIRKLREQVIMNMLISVKAILTKLFLYYGCFWPYFIRYASHCISDLISKTRPRVCSTIYFVICNKEIHLCGIILRQFILKTLRLWWMFSGYQSSELDFQKLYCTTWKQY